MARSRDSQRSKVYEWERPYHKNTLTLSECQALVEEVFKKYSLEAPRVADGRGRSSACYKPGIHVICIPVWARKHSIVLHECAHGLVDKIEPELAWHGPEFARVYAQLLAHYKYDTLSDIITSLKNKNIKVARAADKWTPMARGAVTRILALREQIESINCQILALEHSRAALQNELYQLKMRK